MPTRILLFARMFWHLAAVGVLIYWGWSFFSGSMAVRMIPRLKDLPLEADRPLPKLSVVVPARNEALGIRQCLESLAAQEYDDLEIICVNDRSTDDTGRIADEVAAGSNGRIVVEHVTELPDGWLGKCNALAKGAARAGGDYILFTDGDVIFGDGALRRAMIYTVREKADMLVALPQVITHTIWEHTIMLAFVQAFATAISPWRALNHKSNAFVGVGAFNLVRKSVYGKIAGHRFLRLQVVDDVGLGKLVKYAGGIVRVVFGPDQVTVRWQESFSAHIQGLEKNAFASLKYSAPLATVAILGLLFVNWWPWIGVFTGPWPARAVCLFVALLLQPAMGFGARTFSQMSLLNGFLTPIGATFLAWAIFRSMIMTLRQKGIYWRDTFYPLEQLRQFRL